MTSLTRHRRHLEIGRVAILKYVTAAILEFLHIGPPLSDSCQKTEKNCSSAHFKNSESVRWVQRRLLQNTRLGLRLAMALSRYNNRFVTLMHHQQDLSLGLAGEYFLAAHWRFEYDLAWPRKISP